MDSRSWASIPVVKAAFVTSMMPAMAVPVAPMTWVWKAMLSG